MIRRGVLAVAVMVVAAGCATSEPIAVPAEFSGPVGELLPGATSAAETCANAPVDGPTSGARRMQSEAALDGGSVAALRASGIERGWQPHEVDGADLALRRTLADGAPVDLTAKLDGQSLRVRVLVEYRCSSASGFSFGRVGEPQVLPAQAATLREHRATATAATQAVASAFGASATVDDGAAVDCQAGDSSGVQTTFGVSGRPIAPGRTSADQAASTIATALASWTVEPKPQPKRTELAVSTPGLRGSIIIVGDPATNIAIQYFTTDCVPVA